MFCFLFFVGKPVLCSYFIKLRLRGTIRTNHLKNITEHIVYLNILIKHGDDVILFILGHKYLYLQI